MAATHVAETVILVHGLWFRGWVMQILRWRLRRCGFRVLVFSYPTVTHDLYQNAERLHRFISAQRLQQAHFVGYSLGGLVIRALFAHHRQQPPGRIVTFGTPHVGCYAAQGLSRVPALRWLLGRGIADLLAQLPHRWTLPAREFGTIAGNLSIGGGRVVAGLPRPNDGTVTVAETQLPGASAHAVLAVSHTSMLVAPSVAQQICQFLRSGRFDR